ncbi:STAS domain-containing protein [Dyella jiangningensis]|uniref:Sulfate transporter n=1 Tax=Dyella jiangningensis TaxID=1379159 RepID=A0A328P686_9GAMM|nr:STAS domain-containing protein [Dyella jiangningensis]RAO76843.1 sulfate transporter [Dyella jiangningensis]
MSDAAAPMQVDDITPDTVRVSGVLIFANAAKALDVMAAAVAREGRRVLDLSGVTRSDSAGLACVLAVLSEAAERGRPLTVRNMPEGMHLLASVCEVEGLMA